jgi:hypothetical protein
LGDAALKFPFVIFIPLVVLTTLNRCRVHVPKIA